MGKKKEFEGGTKNKTQMGGRNGQWQKQNGWGINIGKCGWMDEWMDGESGMNRR